MIEDNWWRSRALGDIAAELAKIGEVEKAKKPFDEAIGIVKEIESNFLRSKALAGIAVSIAKAALQSKL